jgi:putative hydrolase of the HAD superfamily
VAETYSAAALRQGVAIDRSEVRARFRRVFLEDERTECRGPLVTDEATECRRWQRIVARVLPELPDPDRGFAELWEHFGRPDAWRSFPDVGPALRSFRAEGVPLRVASNFDTRLRRVVAGFGELADCAGSLVISSEVGYRKPHPAFYRAACRELGLPPERVLCVGDDRENDVLGPRREGMRAVLLDRSGASPVEPDLARVPDLLALIATRR